MWKAVFDEIRMYGLEGGLHIAFSANITNLGL